MSLSKHGEGVAGKVVVSPSQIDTNLFHPASRKWSDIITAVGRLSPEKNFTALINAVALLPWVHLWILGDGPLREELSDLINRTCGDRGTLLGNIPNDQVASVLSWSEYFVLPSLYDQAPKSLLEAMSCECACIVSAQIGVVEDGVTGYLCQPTPDGIRTALEWAALDPTRRAVGEAARKHVLASQAGSGSMIQPRFDIG